MLDNAALTRFCAEFFGYGDLAAPIWFIGMEEGGGASEEEIASRLATWAAQGQPPLADLQAFHLAFGDHTRHVEGAPVQRTWKELMRVMLMLQGAASVDIEALRRYQIDAFGQAGSGTALLELMPLPKPALNAWPYAEWTNADAMPYLQTQAAYHAHVQPQRIAAIRQLIFQHTPQAVVFYGTGYQAQWEAICGAPFAGEAYPRIARNADTVFLLLPHPVARGRIGPQYGAAAELLARMGIPRGPADDAVAA
ncbi:hypothetical protein [Massilia sp. Leaf139]|uniref:hypothetical protein n=1 Tax=Massilia sp. Leaf139 TaxID=1736272 RepID=UPI0006FA9F1A|nr:hypothetical protein [Massilia sp. Leaf139]KQQ86378.1 hypothetical protein ASF77_20605 [Massilia sp. Leaf139]